MQLRKIYFQDFGHKIFDECIVVAKELVEIEKENIKDTRYIFNELEYGISICLLARSYLFLFEKVSTIILISSYLDEKMHFLEDLRDIPILTNMAPNSISPPTKEFVEKKLSLLASVANILHAVDGEYLKIYEIYMHHVERIFGENSL